MSLLYSSTEKNFQEDNSPESQLVCEYCDGDHSPEHCPIFLAESKQKDDKIKEFYNNFDFRQKLSQSFVRNMYGELWRLETEDCKRILERFTNRAPPESSEPIVDTSLKTQVEIKEGETGEQCQISPPEEEKEDQDLAKTAAWLGIEETNKVDEDIENQKLEGGYVEKVAQEYMSTGEEEDMIEKFSHQLDEQRFAMIHREDNDIEVTPEDEPLHKFNAENLREEKGEDEPKEKRLKDKPPDLLNDASEFEEEDWIIDDTETANGQNGDISLKLCDGFLALIDDLMKEHFIVIKDNQSQSEEKMNDMHQKESPDEEESIFLDIEPQRLPEWNVQELNFTEFLDARHLRIYLERKVDGEKGLVSTQSCEDCDSKVRSSWRRKT